MLIPVDCGHPVPSYDACNTFACATPDANAGSPCRWLSPIASSVSLILPVVSCAMLPAPMMPYFLYDDSPRDQHTDLLAIALVAAELPRGRSRTRCRPGYSWCRRPRTAGGRRSSPAPPRTRGRSRGRSDAARSDRGMACGTRFGISRPSTREHWRRPNS